MYWEPSWASPPKCSGACTSRAQHQLRQCSPLLPYLQIHRGQHGLIRQPLHFPRINFMHCDLILNRRLELQRFTRFLGTPNCGKLGAPSDGFLRKGNDRAPCQMGGLSRPKTMNILSSYCPRIACAALARTCARRSNAQTGFSCGLGMQSLRTFEELSGQAKCMLRSHSLLEPRGKRVDR